MIKKSTVKSVAIVLGGFLIAGSGKLLGKEIDQNQKLEGLIAHVFNYSVVYPPALDDHTVLTNASIRLDKKRILDKVTTITYDYNVYDSSDNYPDYEMEGFFNGNFATNPWCTTEDLRYVPIVVNFVYHYKTDGVERTYHKSMSHLCGADDS